MTASVTENRGIHLSLQSLIDTRYDVLAFRDNSQTTGSDYPGQRTGTRRGQGVEFLDLRQYSPGDDVRHIDWNATARSNEPHTRLYRQEKELTTTVLVDLRPVMFNGSDCLRSVAAGHLAAATLWQASISGDRCSSIVIDVDKTNVSRPLTGNKGVLQAIELIATGFDRSLDAINHTGRRALNRGSYGAPQLSDAFGIVSRNKRHTGNTLLFSGFDAEGDDDFERGLQLMAPRGRVTANLLMDKIEQQPLPTGNYRYRYGGSSNKVVINKKNRSALSLRLIKQRNERQDRLKTAGIGTLAVDSSCSAIDFLGKLQQRGWI